MMNIRNGRTVVNNSATQDRTKMEAVEQLTEALRDSNNIPTPKTDFRQLSARYICKAQPGGDPTCTRYSPGPSGYCSLQSQAPDGGFICLYMGDSN